MGQWVYDKKTISLVTELGRTRVNTQWPNGLHNFRSFLKPTRSWLCICQMLWWTSLFLQLMNGLHPVRLRSQRATNSTVRPQVLCTKMSSLHKSRWLILAPGLKSTEVPSPTVEFSIQGELQTLEKYLRNATSFFEFGTGASTVSLEDQGPWDLRLWSFCSKIKICLGTVGQHQTVIHVQICTVYVLFFLLFLVYICISYLFCIGIHGIRSFGQEELDQIDLWSHPR